MSTQSKMSPEQAYRLTAYAKIDKILTRKEQDKGQHRCPEIRQAILAIGAKTTK